MKPPLPFAVALMAAMLFANTAGAQTNVPPIIFSQPQNILTTNGATVTFSVGVSNSYPAALYYQWQFNGTNLPTGGNGNYPANQSTLTLFRITNSSAGPYDAVVTNIYGATTSSVATLTIALPPVITNQPVSQVASNISTVNFSVGATGTGPFTYQWLFNGKMITNNIISTVAGNGLTATGGAGFGGDGGTATNACLNQPTDVTLDADGNLFIADKNNHRIRKVNTGGIITTVAGNGNTGYNGNGNVATNSTLDYPSGVAVDADDNLFIADTYNQRIRVDTYGFLITVAGNGQLGFISDGGSALNAGLDYPAGVTVDGAGNIYIADTDHGRIRKVDLNDNITTVAGNGNLFYAGDGGAATNASLDYPGGLALDAQGNLYIADTDDNRIRKVAANGLITTVAGNGNEGYNGDGGAATNAWLNRPSGVSVDAYGNIFIADTFNNRIRKVGANGIITTVAGTFANKLLGDGGAATNASLDEPYGVTVDAYGNLFIADTFNQRIRKVTPQGATLSVAAGSVTNAGNYQVIVSSAYGSVTSSVAVLTVALPPLITEQPANVTIVNGGIGGIIAEVAGQAPITYQWQFNATNLGVSGTVTQGPYVTLPFSQTTTNNAGAYDVIFSDAFGSVTSSVATLTIAYPPAITNPPVSQTIINGSNAVFGVTATGTAPLSYQWQFNGVNLTDGGEFSGSATTNLVVTAASTNDAGLYDVVIANAWGSVTSSVAALTIVYTPAITNQPVSQSIINGSNAVFSVAATGTAPLSYQWQFNGVNLTDGGEFSGSATTNLVVTAASTNDASLYDVVITNAWGSVTSSVAALTIVYPPGITAQPVNQLLPTGSNASFSVTATGTLPLFCQWQFNGVNLTDGGNLSGSATTNLVVTQVTANNAGNYCVIITNAWGGVTSSVAALTIAYPPAITSQPTNLASLAGKNATFTVTATGTQPLEFRWQFNGMNITNENVHVETANQLFFDPVMTNNAGNYNVIITNAWGSVTSSIVALTILAPTVITSQPVSQIVTNGKTVAFSVGVTGTAPFTYQWLYNGKNLPYNLINTVAGKNGEGWSGDGGTATNATLSQPSGVAVDAGGNLFIADRYNERIRKVNAGGIITTVAGNASTGYNGNGLAATNSWLNSPAGVAVDADDNLFIADTYNSRLRVATYDILITVAGTGAYGFLGDGGPAYNAELEDPMGVAVDAAGDIYIADTYNSRIRKVDLNDNITTVAGNGISVYSGDGGAATNASLNHPNGVAVDAYGDLFIADTSNQRIRKVDTNGIITTVAGKGVGGDGGDGGAATNAYLENPSGVAVDTNGNLYIADTQNSRVRRVGSNGIITTFAGGITYGYAGDGGAATNAWLDEPFGVTVDPHGNVFIADTDNNRIREVTTMGPVLSVNANLTNGGNYQVIVTGAGGSVTSSVALLTVGLAPAITQQPVSENIVNGGNAAFTAGFSGTSLFYYQWQFNHTNLTARDSSQGPSTTLSLSQATTANAGPYDVIITNVYGSVTSSVATLTISLPQISAAAANGGVTLNLLTAANTSSQILVATNLTPPVVWQSIYTNVAGTNGVWQFTDTNTGQYPARFYRTSTP